MIRQSQNYWGLSSRRFWLVAIGALTRLWWHLVRDPFRLRPSSNVIIMLAIAIASSANKVGVSWSDCGCWIGSVSTFLWSVLIQSSNSVGALFPLSVHWFSVPRDFLQQTNNSIYPDRFSTLPIRLIKRYHVNIWFDGRRAAKPITVWTGIKMRLLLRPFHGT